MVAVRNDLALTRSQRQAMYLRTRPAWEARLAAEWRALSYRRALRRAAAAGDGAALDQALSDIERLLARPS